MNPRLKALNDRLTAGQRLLAGQRAEARMVAQRGEELTQEVATLGRQIDLYTKAAGVLASISADRQAEAQLRIETLVTQGLKTIFGDSSLSFHLVSGTRDKVPTVTFAIRSRFGDVDMDTDVVDARGGGMVATVGFLLKLIVKLLTPGRRDSPIVLDETFTFLSADRVPYMALFLRELADKTNSQIIVVTHTPELAVHADRIYHFELANAETKVSTV